MTRERVGELWIASGNPVPSIAITTSTQGGPSSEVQRVGYTGTGPGAMGGTFTLSFGGQTTSGIAYNASAATVQTALTGLSSIGSGNVAVTKTTNTSNTQEWQVTFQGTLAGADQAQITINTGSVTYMYSKSNIQATDTAGGTGSNNEVQVVTLSNATDGTFRLAFAGQTTAPIAYNASNSTVNTALEALTTIGSGHVSVTGSNGGPWTVTFNGGGLAGVNVPSLQGDAASTQSGSVSHTISYTYDTASQLTAASDSDGELDFGYDYIGRVNSETQIVDGLTPHIVLATTYDAASNRTELASTLGSNADFKNTYLYDHDNRMTRVTQQSNSGNTLATKRVDFSFNALSQFDTIDRYQNTGGTNEVVKTSFTYDSLNRLSTLNHDQGATTLNHYSYSYDHVDRISSITSTAEGTSNYTYDKTSQLTAADHSVSGPPDESYSYDANGNRTMSGYTTGTNNRTTTDGTYNYDYDDEGNMTKKTEISSGSYEAFDWDYRNRMMKDTFKNSSNVVQKTVDYHYDIENRMIRRTYDSDGPGGTAATDQFFAYDGIEPILQLEGAADTTLSHRYLWGPAVDQLLADENVTSLGSSGNILWGLSDHLGTPRDIADMNEGTYVTSVTNHRTYNSFGVRTAESNSAVDMLPGFTGKPYDEVTKTQNNINRLYDAVLGQWRREDPIEFDAGDGNLRRHVGNAVTMLTDPLGLDSACYWLGKLGQLFSPPPSPPGVVVTGTGPLMTHFNLIKKVVPGEDGFPSGLSHSNLQPTINVPKDVPKNVQDSILLHELNDVILMKQFGHMETSSKSFMQNVSTIIELSHLASLDPIECTDEHIAKRLSYAKPESKYYPKLKELIAFIQDTKKGEAGEFSFVMTLNQGVYNKTQYKVKVTLVSNSDGEIGGGVIQALSY